MSEPPLLDLCAYRRRRRRQLRMTLSRGTMPTAPTGVDRLQRIANAKQYVVLLRRAAELQADLKAAGALACDGDELVIEDLGRCLARLLGEAVSIEEGLVA